MLRKVEFPKHIKKNREEELACYDDGEFEGLPFK